MNARVTLLLLAAVGAVAFVAWIATRDDSADLLPPSAPTEKGRSGGSGEAPPPLRPDREVPDPEPPLTWKLVVVVKNQGGVPLRKARVVFIGEDGRRTKAWTSGTGRARLTVLGAGDVGVEHPAHAPQLIRDVAAPAGSERRIDVTLGAGLTITGMVLDENGRPITRENRVTVTAAPMAADWYEISEWEVTTRDGRFELTRLPPGTFRLEVDAFRGLAGRSPEPPVTAKAGDRDVLIRLDPTLGVTLRLEEAETGALVLGACEVAVESEKENQHLVFGVHSGRLVLRELPARESKITVSVPGYLKAVVKVKAVPGRPEIEVPVKLEKDPRASRVVLVITDEKGRPVEKVKLGRVFKGGTVIMNEDRKAPGGRLVLPVASGEHEFRVSDDRGASAKVSVAVAPGRRVEVDVILTEER